MEHCQVDNNVMVGIRSAAGGTVVVSNSTLTQNSDKDLWLGGNSKIEMRNSSFNKNQVTYADPGSSLHVSWFLGINVSWPTGGMVEGADVTVKDHEGTEVWTGTTDATGDIGTKIVVKEFTKSQSTQLDYTPHNITAQISAVVIGYLEETVDISKNVKVVLGDLTDPLITVTTPANNDVFNKTIVTVSGTASDPESDIMRVDVSYNSGTTWSKAEGTATWTDDIALADGEHTIDAKATNYAGGETIVTITGIFVDTNTPFIKWTAPDNNSLQNTKSVLVSGETEPDAKVTINGLETNASNIGEYSLEISLNEGPNTITVEAEDRAMNYRMSRRYVTVDSIAPFIKVDGPATRSVSNFQDEIEGTTEPGARVTINDANVNTNPTTGVFSYPVMLEEGTNTYLIEATDRAGNSNSTTVTLILDTSEPSLEILYPEDGAILRTKTIIAKAMTDLDPGATAYINSEVADLSGGGFSKEITLNEGENTIYFKVVDSSGNEISDSVKVTVDSTVPTIEINYKTGSKVKTDKIMIEGDTEARASVVVNGISVTAGGTGHFSVEVPLKVGQNTIEITVTDKAGNEAHKSIEVERETGGNGGGGGGGGDDPVSSSLPMILAIVLILIVVMVAAAMLLKGGDKTPPPGARRRQEPGGRPSGDGYPKRDPYGEDRGDDYADDGQGDEYGDDYQDDYDDDHGDGYDDQAEGEYGDGYDGHEEGYEKERGY